MVIPQGIMLLLSDWLKVDRYEPMNRVVIFVPDTVKLSVECAIQSLHGGGETR